MRQEIKYKELIWEMQKVHIEKWGYETGKRKQPIKTTLQTAGAVGHWSLIL